MLPWRFYEDIDSTYSNVCLLSGEGRLGTGQDRIGVELLLLSLGLLDGNRVDCLLEGGIMRTLCFGHGRQRGGRLGRGATGKGSSCPCHVVGR